MKELTEPGRIVVLNGPSSSGKTTIALATRAPLGEACVALSIDDLFRAVHPQRRDDWSLFLSLTKVLFECAASSARRGFAVVVDTVFERPECHLAYLESCTRFDGVSCESNARSKCS